MRLPPSVPADAHAPRRVTLKQIAATTGFHHSTVSRALRGDRSLPALTRQQISAAADRLGYRPDPYLAGLIAHRNAQRARPFRAVLAWMNCWPERAGWRQDLRQRQYFLGAQRRAEALGYQLEEFWLAAPALSAARAIRVLQARRIDGLLFGPQPHPLGLTDFDFSSFAAIAIGHTLPSPALHTVTSDHYENAATLVRTLQAQGFHRVGYVSSSDDEARTAGRWHAGYHWAVNDGSRPSAALPALVLSGGMDRSEIATWIGRHRPDAIVATCPQRVLPQLAALGIRVPDDISLASPALNDDARFVAGMSEHAEVIGASAIEVLVDQLHRNERGVPEVARRMAIVGSWVDGPSVRLPRFNVQAVVA